MWTPSIQWPLSMRSSEIASSKSRASIGSIVMIVELGEIAAAAADRFVELLGLLARVFEHVVVEFARQIEFVDDRHRVDARLAAAAEDFDDHALAVVNVRGEADHFDDDFVIGPHAFRTGIADVDRVGEDLAVDLHHAHAGLLEIDADEAVGGALDDVDDAAFLFAHAAALRFEADRDDVAAGGVAAFIGGDEDIGIAAFGALRAFGPDEAEAAGRAAEGAGEMFRIARLASFFVLSVFRSTERSTAVSGLCSELGVCFLVRLDLCWPGTRDGSGPRRARRL